MGTEAWIWMAVWAVVMVLVVWLLVREPRHEIHDDPGVILRARYARGEIREEEYKRAMAAWTPIRLSRGRRAPVTTQPTRVPMGRRPAMTDQEPVSRHDRRAAERTAASALAAERRVDAPGRPCP